MKKSRNQQFVYHQQLQQRLYQQQVPERSSTPVRRNEHPEYAFKPQLHEQAEL